MEPRAWNTTTSQRCHRFPVAIPKIKPATVPPRFAQRIATLIEKQHGECPPVRECFAWTACKYLQSAFCGGPNDPERHDDHKSREEGENGAERGREGVWLRVGEVL